MRDLHNNIKIDEVFAATTPGTGDKFTDEIDMQGFGSAEISVSSVATAAGTLTMQESDVSGSGFADAPAAAVLGTQGVALVNGEATKLGYVGSKRFARGKINVSSDGVISANALQGHASQATVN